MVDTVYIYLHNEDPEKVDWMMVDDQNTIISPPSSANIKDIKQHLQYRTIVLFVPGIAVTTTMVKLPPTTRNRMIKALPFILEEQLIDEVENVHFVLGEGAILTEKPVALALKKDLRTWLLPWQEPTFFCQTLLPDYLAIPYSQEEWTIVILEEYAIVRTGKLSGFSSELTNLLLLLNAAKEHISPQAPLSIRIINYLKNPAIDLSQIKLPGAATTIETNPLPLLELFAKHYQSALSMNLLQGEFRQKPLANGNKSIWKKTAIVAAFALCLLIIKDMTELLVLKHQYNTLNHNVENIYRDLFPKATSVVAPKVRIERELKNLEKIQSGGGFLGLLADTGSVIKDISHLSIEGLLFQNNQLAIDIKANSFETVEQATNQLRQHDLSVTQENAASHDNIITARLRILG